LSPRELSLGLRSQRAGLLLSLIAILSGFALGGVFGAFEEGLKAGLDESARKVLAETYAGDPAAARTVVEGSWTYYQRAHLHWGAIGAASLAVSLLLAAVVGPSLGARLASTAMGLGALVYPMSWLLAGRSAPKLGSTGAATDALRWLSVPGGALLLAGAAGSVVLLSARLYGSRPG
jgi:hypothetical protein